MDVLDSVRSKRRLWLVLATLCLLAASIGFLAKPVDELAGIESFHPRTERVSMVVLATAKRIGGTLYQFSATRRKANGSPSGS